MVLYLLERTCYTPRVQITLLSFYTSYANAISRLQPLIRPSSYIIIELVSQAKMDHDLGMLEEDWRALALATSAAIDGHRYEIFTGAFC
jgi:hypothetical protein